MIPNTGIDEIEYVKRLISRHPTISIPFLQYKLKRTYEDCKRIYDHFFPLVKEKIPKEKNVEIVLEEKPIVEFVKPKRFKIKKDGSYTDENGYRKIFKLGHPNAVGSKGLISEHTWVMSQHIGRPLRKRENVHHKNGRRDDNRIENLELWDKIHPPGQRVKDKISWCKQYLSSHGYETMQPI